MIPSNYDDRTLQETLLAVKPYPPLYFQDEICSSKSNIYSGKDKKSMIEFISHEEPSEVRDIPSKSSGKSINDLTQVLSSAPLTNYSPYTVAEKMINTCFEPEPAKSTSEKSKSSGKSIDDFAQVLSSSPLTNYSPYTMARKTTNTCFEPEPAKTTSEKSKSSGKLINDFSQVLSSSSLTNYSPYTVASKIVNSCFEPELAKSTSEKIKSSGKSINDFAHFLSSSSSTNYSPYTVAGKMINTCLQPEPAKSTSEKVSSHKENQENVSLTSHCSTSSKIGYIKSVEREKQRLTQYDKSSSDTETEAPLSQETYAVMKELQPNLSDDINSCFNLIKDEDNKKKEPQESDDASGRSINISSKDELSAQKSIIQHVNAIPNDKLSVSGSYLFKINLECKENPAKSCKYTYSNLLDKLFIQMDKSVPIRFETEIAMPARGSEIRAYLVYKDEQSRELVVDRCPHHVQQNEGFPQHVLVSADGTHLVCPSTKRYITVIKPAITQVHDINQFVGEIRFRCSSGCRGGIDRRATYVLFELYIHKRFSGRALLEVSICTSPGRDRYNQEKKFLLKNGMIKNDRKRNALSNTEGGEPPSKKQEIIENGDESFLIRVNGYENALLVSSLAEKLNQNYAMQKGYERK